MYHRAAVPVAHVIMRSKGDGMKKLSIVLLAVVMVAGLAGCSGGDAGDCTPEVVGAWTQKWNVACKNTVLLTKTMFINPDGTYGYADRKIPGRWTLTGKNLTMTEAASGNAQTWEVDCDGRHMENKSVPCMTADR